MAKLSITTKTYIITSIVVGFVNVFWFLRDLHTDPSSLVMLFILFILASLAQIIKVEGATSRSHYAASFLIYAFTIFNLGLVETMLVIMVSYFSEWLWRRPAWYISSFNSAALIIVSTASFYVYKLLNPGNVLLGWRSVVGIIAAMVTFTLFNHLMVGIIVWMARGENFIQSGIFDFLPLTIDLTLLMMGASFYLIWNFNQYAILLFLPPIYLVYNTLRMPALERQTELDPKTGLYNNAYFLSQLENELSRAQRFDRPLSVLMADLDFLRNINNTYGHLAGDEVLITIARILQATVREYDLVARFGGEEFSVLMPETSVDVAFERAETIRRTIEAADFTIATSVTPIKVTMSIGVASRLKPNQTKEEIIHNADTVLYQAKKNGRNRTIIYRDGMYDQTPDHEQSKSPENSKTIDQAPIPARAADANAQVTRPRNTYSEARKNHHTAESASSTEETLFNPLEAPSKAPAELDLINRRVYLFIFMLATCAAVLFSIISEPFDLSNLAGLSLFILLLIFTEANSTEIYVRDTAISTSAAPLVAGSLLYGPVGAVILSIVFAITTYLKYKGPKNRIIFNTANQVIPAMLFLGFIRSTGIPFFQWPDITELLITIMCMAIVYATTTSMVSVGISLNTGTRLNNVWMDQFSWLAPYYLTMGVIAYALIFGYTHAGLLGLAIIVFPLMMLSLGQIQYLDRTRTMVTELREKNSSLERSSEDILHTNEGLLETLADLIDLRDHYMLGHSQQVSLFAVMIAEKLGFKERRIQMLRKACLVHDLGKLGIPETILAKPATLSADEYNLMKNHPAVGASLLSKNPSLKDLIPTVRHHHEYYNGQGYPDGLKGNNIPLEARIVAVADAIDAMSSNRVYRQALDRDMIIAELKHNAGIQFDSQIAAIAIDLLKSGKMKIECTENKTQNPR